MKQAPDFWSWRSGLCLFGGEEGDADASLGGIAKDFVWNLSHAEKRERRELLEHLLGELNASRDVNPERLARVHEVLGQAASFEGDTVGSSADLQEARSRP